MIAQRLARVAAVALCVTGVGWLAAACSPAVEGTSGVRLDGDGRLTAVFAWCPGFDLTQVAVYPATPGGGVGDLMIRLKRTGHAPDGSYLELDIVDPPPGWEALRTATIDDNGTYEIRAWNGNGSATVAGFPFTMEELRSTPADGGTILTKKYIGNDEYQSAFLTPQQFQDRAGQRCDG